MDETLAREKHACAACGAPATWDPATQVLRCPYCGTQAQVELDRGSGEIRELDLLQALRELPDKERGWQIARRTVRCRSCNAVSVFDPARVGQNCEFCGSPQLVDYQEIKAPIRPRSLLPFRVDAAQVREQIRTWLAGRWFAPSGLKHRALVDTVAGLYLPYWTFDAQVHCPWTAEAGHYYYTTETYRDSNGRTQTRRVRHVRWVPAAGVVDHFFDDEPVPGSQGIETDLLRRIEPFPTAELVPYDTAYLSGFVVEHYQVVLVDAARQARESMDGHLRSMCAARIPGDTYRNLQIYPDYSGQTFKHILVPVWHLRYDFGRRKYRVLVNGYTGKMAGEYPKSFWKIFFLILFLLVLLGVVIYVAQ
jgi:hypothetical protein